MLEKLISIKNIGKLAKLNLKKGSWDGMFSKSNIIYAPNGTGKTTLSMVFQSMKGEVDLIKKKATFKSIQSDDKSQHFSIRANGATTEYRNGVWTNPINDIEVFNVHFVEENLFTGSGQHRKNQQNLFLFLSGDEGLKKKSEIDKLRNKIVDYRQKERGIRNRARKGSILMQNWRAQIQLLKAEREPLEAEVRLKNKDMGLYSKELFNEFISRTNTNLANFSRHLRLEKISKELDQRTTFYLQLDDNRVTFDENVQGHEFRYTLSEGDKSTLAISLFLAKISFATKPENLIVIFDDPLTSLDSGRRFITIKELSKLADKIGQLVVLTHDATFAADLEREMRVQNLSLELVYQNKESWLTNRCHQEQNVTGLFRDLKTLTDFQQYGAVDASERRDVIRCIRPTLEGLIRVKYYDILSDSQWLGDFIKMVRSANASSDLFRLQSRPIFDMLCDINDYSKRHHHSSPSERDTDVDENELSLMVDKTLNLIKKL